MGPRDLDDRARLEAEYLRLLEAEDYYQAEQKFAHFTRAAWRVLEPSTPYLHNWHIDCIAEHLEAVYSGQIRRLIVNEPPRHMKSIQITVCFPAWLWVKRASFRYMSASYAASLALKHSVDRRTLIESPWYQRGWGDRVVLSVDNNQKSEFSNTARGHQVATSVGGSVTGKGADILNVDDPHDPLRAASDVERETALNWFDQTWSTRLDNDKTGAMIVVMQRLHEKDLTGHLLGKGGWEQLSLPAEAPTKKIIVFPISKREIVREEGACLWPERQGPKELAQKKIDLGTAGFQSQYQQDPKPMKGGFFKRPWWKTYQELPAARIRRVQFWDCASVPGVSNDYTVCATWDQTTSGFYLVDLWCERVEFPDLERACKNLYEQYKPNAVVIENKASGIQLIQTMRRTTTLPIVAYEPGQNSKVIRAAGAQPTVEAGNCFLPESRPWVELFISRHEKFPNDDHDDEVDTTSMMVEFFRGPVAQPRIRSL